MFSLRKRRSLERTCNLCVNEGKPCRDQRPVYHCQSKFYTAHGQSPHIQPRTQSPPCVPCRLGSVLRLDRFDLTHFGNTRFVTKTKAARSLRHSYIKVLYENGVI